MSSSDVILDGSLNSSSPRRMRVKAAFKRFNQMRLANSDQSPRHCAIAAAAAAASSAAAAAASTAIVPVTVPSRMFDARVASVSSSGSSLSSSSESLFLRNLGSSLCSSAGDESLRLRKQNTKRLSLLLKELVFIDGNGGNHERFIEEESVNLRVMREDPEWNLF